MACHEWSRPPSRGRRGEIWGVGSLYTQVRWPRIVLIAAVGAMLLAILPCVGTAGVPGERSASAHATGLTITRVTTGAIIAGQPVQFTGKAPRWAVGKRVQLQRKTRRNGAWLTVDRARVGTRRTWNASGKAIGPGRNYWRAVVISGAKSAKSSTVKHKAFGWYYLYDMSDVDHIDFNFDSITMGGRLYPKSAYSSRHLDQGNSGWSEWNLGYKCIGFKSAIGIGDSSETGARATFRVYLDGAVTDLGAKGLGTTSEVTIDTRGNFRIKLESTHTTDNLTYAGWGSPRVLCADDPASGS